MITSKKRQDFRIQLQKRARRRAHKKIEYLEDDKNWKEVIMSQVFSCKSSCNVAFQPSFSGDYIYFHFELCIFLFVYLFFTAQMKLVYL